MPDDPRDSRYDRQKILPGFGALGQDRISASHAVVVGCGALGCAAADLLARAGVGRLTLVDRDVVEWSNLQRQALFDEADAASDPPVPKAEAARRRLARINSTVRIEAVVSDLDHRNAMEILGEQASADAGRRVVVDGTDNFETRYLLNDLSVRLGIPYAYAGVVGTSGMAALFRPETPGLPCLRCLFEQPPAPGVSPTCDVAGVLGPAVAIVAGMQIGEVLRLLAAGPDAGGEAGSEPGSVLVQFDLAAHRFRTVSLRGARRADCPCCGAGRFEFLRGEHAPAVVSLCGRRAVQISPRAGGFDLSALAERLGGQMPVKRSAFLLTATIPSPGDPLELTVFRDGRAIVHGTDSPERARSIYARFVGS